MCLKTERYLDRNIYSIPHSVTVTTHNTHKQPANGTVSLTDRQTHTYPHTHARTHTPLELQWALQSLCSYGLQKQRHWHSGPMLATWRATSTRVLTNNKHARRFKERKQECFKRSLGKIFIITTRPYLAIEVEEVKGVHTHLDFDLRGIHILQGDINTHGYILIFFPLTKICK